MLRRARLSRRFADSLLLCLAGLGSCVGGTTGREKLNTHPPSAGAPTSGGLAGAAGTAGVAGSVGAASTANGGAAGVPDEPTSFGGALEPSFGGMPPEAMAGAGGAATSAWCDGMLCSDGAACRACLQANIDNTNCEGVYPPCAAVSGNAKDGPAATSPKLELCQATYACGQRTKCYKDNLADCYCGSQGGVACLGTGAADGPCRTDIEDGLESTDPSAIAQHLTSTEYAAGVAMLLLSCAQQYCFDECVTGTSAGVGGAGH